MMRAVLIIGALALSACGGGDAENTSAPAANQAATNQTAAGDEEGAQDAFLASIAGHCGKSYAGRVVTTDPADSDFAGKPLVMHVASCGGDQIKIPFHVGGDRSRTWVLTRTQAGMRLKHDHRHKDGTSDVLTMYGGDTANAGSATRQEFPVDAESIALFRANGAERSVTNIWAMEVTADKFAYELRRENRHFRVEFDLSKTVDTPPMPWGWKE